MEKKPKKKRKEQDSDEEILGQIRKREAANTALKKMLEELEKRNK